MVCWKRSGENKKKQPIINEELCTKCGMCVQRCKNGVFDSTKGSSPVVIEPDRCQNGCAECGEACPAKAISYVDDNGEIIKVGCDFCGGCF